MRLFLRDKPGTMVQVVDTDEARTHVTNILAIYVRGCYHEKLSDAMKCKNCVYHPNLNTILWNEFRVSVFQTYGIEIPPKFIKV